MNNEFTPATQPACDQISPPDAQVQPDAAVALPHTLPIFLVGMMGAGKTTIGKGLARVLQRDFVDLDHELEARCGVRIPVIFEIEGEAGFRKRECQVLEDCTIRQNIVMATGGGAVLSEQNRASLRARGIVVYLRASVDELFRRTSRDRNRPLLATPDPKGTLRKLLEMREPLYNEVADVIIDTGTTPVSQLVARLVDRLKTIEKTIDPLAKPYQAQAFQPFVHPVPGEDPATENQACKQ